MRFLSLMLPATMLLSACSGIFAPSQNFSAPGACGALAAQRLQDARNAGLADGYEKAIFDYNYQACVKQEQAGQPR